jgi:hypothetical protein
MSKFVKVFIFSNVVSAIFTSASINRVSFGFMGGQVYAGFPIISRLGYSPSLISFLIVTLVNGLVFMALAYLVIVLAKILRHKHRRR